METIFKIALFGAVVLCLGRCVAQNADRVVYGGIGKINDLSQAIAEGHPGIELREDILRRHCKTHPWDEKVCGKR